MQSPQFRICDYDILLLNSWRFLRVSCQCDQSDAPIPSTATAIKTITRADASIQAKAYRRALWLDQNDRRLAKDPPPGTRPDRMVLCPHRRRIQSDPYPKASANRGISLPGVTTMMQNPSPRPTHSANQRQSIHQPCSPPSTNPEFQQPASLTKSVGRIFFQ